MPVIVAVQLMTAERVAYHALIPHGDTGDRFGRVPDQEEIEVAVAVVVEEGGLGGVAGIGDAVPRCHLAKARDAVLHSLVHVQRVRA